MKKKMKETENFSPENIRRKRKFPKANTVWLILILLVQIALILFAVLYTPKPKDRIERYEVKVLPLFDGTLNITYNLRWEAISDEELTWVEIGIPNKYFEVDKESLSENIARYEKYVDMDYVSLKLFFK